MFLQDVDNTFFYLNIDPKTIFNFGLDQFFDKIVSKMMISKNKDENLKNLIKLTRSANPLV